MAKEKDAPKTGAMKMSQAECLELRNTLVAIIDHHTRFSKSYFWTPPRETGVRRWEEKKNTWYEEFDYNGHHFFYISEVKISCKNYYYSGRFEKDDEVTNVRPFKKILTELEEVIQNCAC